MNRAARWEIPEPRSVCEVRQDDGSVTILRRHGNPAGPRLLLGHGNGLAMDFYYPFWSLLTGDFDVLLYDLRNHGWNTVGARPEHHLPNLVRDQERVVDAAARRYGERRTTGVFHSLSALTALLSSALGTGGCDRLSAWVLFDPPLYHPGPTTRTSTPWPRLRRGLRAGGRTDSARGRISRNSSASCHCSPGRCQGRRI